jgi:hypothetical protein
MDEFIGRAGGLPTDLFKITNMKSLNIRKRYHIGACGWS